MKSCKLSKRVANPVATARAVVVDGGDRRKQL